MSSNKEEKDSIFDNNNEYSKVKEQKSAASALSTDDAYSPPSLDVILVMLPILSGDIVIVKPSVTKAAEVPLVVRSAVVLPDLSPIVEFGFTEPADNPPLT
jgi:hypothetical protein